jgi:homoserine dehydrogenase
LWKKKWGGRLTRKKEPDPRDDLNGVDVARKVTILGRISGLDLDLSTLTIENIVPESLRTVKTPEEFLQKLPEFDTHFESLNKEAEKEGCVLRYVGVVEGESSRVKLMKYPLSHPFASLKGSDNIIAFSDILKIQDRVTYKL